MMTQQEYEQLLNFCTDRQREILTAYFNSSNKSNTANSLGISGRSVRRTIAAIRKKAASQGFSPQHDMTKTVPDGFVVSGVSTYYNDEGKPTGQWVKSRLKEEDKLVKLRDAIDEMMDVYTGLAPTTKLLAKPERNDIMVAIPIGDPHIGMYAWGEECGENFDLEIARGDMLAAVNEVVRSAPSCNKCVIINLGDFFHADNLSNTTTRSGHALDVDSRWPRVLQLGCMLMVDSIQIALKKFTTVEVINAIGNHDDHSSIMLSSFLGAYFHHEKRVTVHPTISKFHYVKFGKNLIGVTHGDTVKANQLGELMAADKAEDWGKTEFRYWYCGHIHHSTRLELRGCTVESFRTLAAKDSYHAAHGYRSGRDLNSIVLHKEFGEIARYRCDIRLARHGRRD